MSTVAGRAEADGAVREVASKRPRSETDASGCENNLAEQLAALKIRADAAEAAAKKETAERAEAEAAARKAAEAEREAAEAARKAAEERAPPHIAHLPRAAGLSRLLVLLMAAAAVAVAPTMWTSENASSCTIPLLDITT